MNIMVWSIRGLRTLFAHLHHLVHVHKLNLLALIEPKHPSVSITRFGLDLGFAQSHASSSGKIWLYWRQEIFRLVDVQDANQVLHLQFCSSPLNLNFTCSVVYAQHTILLQRQLWQALREYSQQMATPWLVCGDFNTFRTLDNHPGRSQPMLSALQDFNDCIEYCALMDLPFHGTRYTWTDGHGLGQVWRRLDWIFINSLFQDAFDKLSLTHLPRISSGHTPLFLICDKLWDIGRRKF